MCAGSLEPSVNVQPSPGSRGPRAGVGTRPEEAPAGWGAGACRGEVPGREKLPPRGERSAHRACDSILISPLETCLQLLIFHCFPHSLIHSLPETTLQVPQAGRKSGRHQGWGARLRGQPGIWPRDAETFRADSAGGAALPVVPKLRALLSSSFSLWVVMINLISALLEPEVQLAMMYSYSTPFQV